MKKSLTIQLFALLLYYLYTIFDVRHEGIFISDNILIGFVFIIYHASLFFIVNYILIPKLFYSKKFVWFFSLLFALIVIYGIGEEGVVEKILDINHRGANNVNWQSIYWFFGEIGLPLLIFMTIKFVFDNFEQQRKMEAIKKDSLTNELKFLKSQIQPHILFNSLNNLYDYTLSKSDEAPKLVLLLSDVLRYVLYETTTDKVKIKKELEFIENYVSLQKIQIEDRGYVTLLINELTKKAYYISPFILIPFIENAFKHSLNTKEHNILITITITIDNTFLKMIVENNFDDQYKRNEDIITKGIGLKNVKKRLELLYQNKHDLKITTVKNHYTTELHINLL